MDENNPVNQGSLDKEKIGQLKKEMENIGNKSVQEIPPQPSQPIQQPGTFDPLPPVAPEVANSQGLKKSKGILWIALTLLLLALVGVGAYYLGSNKTAAEPVPTANTNQTPTPTPDPTADWETYTNEEDGYSVKYPADRYIRLICPGEELTLVGGTGSTKEQPNPVKMPTCSRGSRYSLEIVTSDEPPEVRPKTDQYHSVTKENVLVNDVKAEKYISTLITTEPGQYIEWYTQVLIEHGDKYYWIYFDLEDQVGVFDQILSTFKFIESTPSATTTP